MRTLAIAILYALSLALLWAGTRIAPQIGWPTTDLEVHGCALIVLAMVAKTIGHWLMLATPGRLPGYA